MAEVMAGSPGTHHYLPIVSGLQSHGYSSRPVPGRFASKGVASPHGATVTIPDLCPGCGSVEILLTFKRTLHVREWVGRCSNCQKVWTFDP